MSNEPAVHLFDAFVARVTPPGEDRTEVEGRLRRLLLGGCYVAGGEELDCSHDLIAQLSQRR